jgi:RNA methyltransferase, TrmH family
MPRQSPLPIASQAAVSPRSSAPSASNALSDIIRSRDNRWLKTFRAALRGGGPNASEPIGVEGPKLVEEGLRVGLQAEALLVSETGERDLERVLHAARETETGISRSRILRTTDRLFRSVAGTEMPQGMAALFRQREWRFEDVLRGAASREGALRGDAPLVVVLAGIQDPGNVGTILRSAAAFGATGAIATRGTADPWSPKAVRASAGSALGLPVLRGMAVPVILAQLRVAEVRIYASISKSAEGGIQHRAQCEPQRATGKTGIAANLDQPAAIFIGSEGHGLPPEIEHAADAVISVPIGETVESLNAAVAASILLYEAARQRRA